MSGQRPFAGAGAACLLLAGLCGGCGPGEPAAYDVLIVGGTLYDGSAAEPRTANVAVRGERIVAVDAAADAPAALTIDATGLAVMPGFIDPHTHALPDLLEPATSANLNYLAQGVTTVFVGNDGAGLRDRAARLARLTEQGTGTHVAFYAGHNELRRRAMGLENRAPSAAELQAMQAMLAREMEAGALGLSTGLFYTPGSFATTDEVVALARVAASHGGVYDTHMRSESSFAAGVREAVGEVLTIAEEAAIPVHIAHLKALGSDVWGASGDIIAMIEGARDRGLKVTADQYPYQASGTRFSSALVPQWARADSHEAMLARFDNPDLEDRLRAEMADNLRIRGGPGAMLVTGIDSDWRGMTLDDIARELDTDPLEAAQQVIRGGDPSIASFVMDAQDIHAIAIQPWVMTGSDGSEGHPRKYGSYPQAYREFVVEQALMSLPRFVHRSSGLPADTFGLCDRGYVRVGRLADIAIVDLEDYAPRADFERPQELATGVRHLLVAGVPVIAESTYTGRLPGQVVNRRSLDCP